MIFRLVFSVQRDLMILKAIVYLQAQLFLHRCHGLHRAEHCSWLITLTRRSGVRHLLSLAEIKALCKSSGAIVFVACNVGPGIKQAVATSAQGACSSPKHLVA